VEKGTLRNCWWKLKLEQPLWKFVQRFLKKQKIELLYDPAILVLRFSQKNVKPRARTWLKWQSTLSVSMRP
jgi:hypothetical protein